MIDSTFWKDKRVFLTGHTGFKGSWLSIWLNQLGANVLGYALEPNTEPSLFYLAKVEELVDSVIGDVRDLELLQKTILAFKPEIVIHMAAQPLVRESYENPVDTYAINIMGTVNVLESVRQCKSIMAVVNVTTDKVYENKEWIWGYREIDRLGGYDPYSNSKACSELVTSSYINSFFHPNEYEKHKVAIATARAGNVIGGGDWAKDRLIPDIMQAIENNDEIIIRNPNAIRPWQHVLEPLSGYLMLCEKLYVEGTRWNGAWNFGPSLNEAKNVMCIVENLLEMSCKSLKINFNKSSVLHETNLLNLDCSKSKEILKWEPIWDINKALMKIVEWNRNVHSGSSIYEICLKQIRDYSNEIEKAKR